MEFRRADTIPAGDWLFEPKWDGFRCIATRDGKRVTLTSKKGQSLNRYFPEIIVRLLSVKSAKFVVDGEIMMRSTSRTFDDLLQRIHPAASRVSTLAKSTPADLMVFDLLTDEHGSNLMGLPLAERRKRLKAFARKYFGRVPGLKLSPATTSRTAANKWLSRPKASMDGVIAKDLQSPYRADTRDGGIKVKRVRTADCVVGGFRYTTSGGAVGSLLLGLYDDSGKLNHVGFTSGFSDDERRKLVPKLEKLIKPPGFTGKAPGGPSRWSTKRTDEWKPLEPKLVVEVAFDRVTNDRIRHGAKFIRWRPDKSPRKCTIDQL